MLKTTEIDVLFSELEAGRVTRPEQTLAALAEGIVGAARTKEWGTASLLALAAFRIDAGKAPDLARINEDLSRLFAEWDA